MTCRAAACLAAAALLLAPLLAAEVPPVTVAATAKSSPGWMASHRKYVQRAQAGDVDVLFLGDSITEWWLKEGAEVWAREYAAAKVANFGIAGDRVEHILWRVQNGELEGLAPKVVVLLAGINNTWGCKRDEQDARGAFVAEGLTQIVQTLRQRCPGSRVLLLAIFPLTDGRAPCVRRANEALARLDDGATVRFLDLADRLAGPDGKARQECMKDSVHLSAKGYAAWAEGMKPLLTEMLAQASTASAPAGATTASAPATAAAPPGP